MGKAKKSKLTPCDKCAEFKRADVVSNVPLQASVPYLNSTKEWDHYKSVVKDATARHFIPSDKLLAEYDFRGNGWRGSCSLGGHSHAWGYIGESACGELLIIGNKCGLTCIDGLKDATKRAEERRRYDAAKVAMKRIVEEVVSILPSKDAASGLLTLRRGIQESLPNVASQLRKLEERRFAGLALWQEESHDVQKLHSQFANLNGEYVRLRLDARPREVEKLTKALGELHRRAISARQWFDQAAPFAKPETLREVVRAFGVADTTVDEQGVVTINRGRGPQARPIIISAKEYRLGDAKVSTPAGSSPAPAQGPTKRRR